MNKKDVFVGALINGGREYCKIFITSFKDVEQIVFECVSGEDIKADAERVIRFWAKYFHDKNAVLRVKS